MKVWTATPLVLATLAVGTAPSATTPEPPPPAMPTYEVGTYAAPSGAVSCADGDARVLVADAPPSYVTTARPAAPAVAPGSPLPAFVLPAPSRTYEYTFDVTAEGRLVSLRRSAPTPSPYDSADHLVQATMASWRFAPGPPRTGCRWKAESTQTPLARTDRAVLFRMMSETRPGQGRLDVWRAVHPEGSDCARVRPKPRVRVYPPLDQLEREPGRPHWVRMVYDVDAGGVPVNVRPVASTGHARLEAEVQAALEASRFAPEPRRGCIDGQVIRAADLEAPPRPNIATFVRPGDDCPNTEGRKKRMRFVDGNRFYPAGFRERGIKGWAIVRFDVAPWGALGPPEVVAAEPAAAFGQAAMNITRTARAEPGEGWRGCLQHFMFELSDEGEEHEFTTDLRLR